MNTKFKDVFLLEPNIFSDERGFFLESFNSIVFSEIVGKKVDFVQDNHSYSTFSVTRGLHYQIPKPQGKLVRVVHGEVFDVIVDLRLSSDTFGQWQGFILNSKNLHSLWIPEGFAHGFQVLSKNAHFLYKTTEFWFPENENTILWNDDCLNILWPISNPVISSKDQSGRSFSESIYF